MTGVNLLKWRSIKRPLHLLMCMTFKNIYIF